MLACRNSEDESLNGGGASAALEARVAERERISERHKEELQKHHQSLHPVCIPLLLMHLPVQML